MRKVAPNAMALQSGPDQYEGLLKDLLELLAADLEFDYFLEEDFIHGFPTADGNWTGIIGSLVDRVTKFNSFLNFKGSFKAIKWEKNTNCPFPLI